MTLIHNGKRISCEDVTCGYCYPRFNHDYMFFYTRCKHNFSTQLPIKEFLINSNGENKFKNKNLDSDGKNPLTKNLKAVSSKNRKQVRWS